MQEQSVVYKPRLGYPLHVTAKRYWLPAFEQNTDDPNALTLILLHSTSFHKETWEPTLEKIFRRATQNGAVRIRDAWALDCPNHGASAALNRRALQQEEFHDNFTCEKYARGVHHFLSAGPEHGACVDFRKRKLVGIGHSLGSVAMTILQDIEPAIMFSSIVLVEPMLSPAGPEYLFPLRIKLVKSAYERRDVWPSSDEALDYFQKGIRATKWHPHVIRLFVKYALIRHPGSQYPDVPYNGVTLACSREQEAAMYRDAEGPTKPIMNLDRACRRMPVHIIFGGTNDYIPREVHDAVIDPKSGRRFASVTRIPGSGHLVPQTVPEKLGDVIFTSLSQNAALPTRTKL